MTHIRQTKARHNNCCYILHVKHWPTFHGNKKNHPMSSNSHPRVATNKSRHLVQRWGGGLKKWKGHHRILTHLSCSIQSDSRYVYLAVSMVGTNISRIFLAWTSTPLIKSFQWCQFPRAFCCEKLINEIKISYYILQIMRTIKGIMSDINKFHLNKFHSTYHIFISFFFLNFMTRQEDNSIIKPIQQALSMSECL